MLTKLQGFIKFIEKHNPEVVRVSAEFPYQGSDEKAYVVTFKGITQYLFFNSDGDILVQKRIE